MHFVVLAAIGGACSAIVSPENNATSSEPATFAPGVISTDDLEYSITFTPDCRTAYFSRRVGDWGSGENTDPSILESHWREGAWSPPAIAAFSGQYGDDDPFVTPDGQYLYFASNRPKTPNAEKADYDIWRVERLGDGWSLPERLPEPVNSNETEYSPVLGLSGAIYFASDRTGGLGQGDIYVAHREDAFSYALDSLSASINSPLGEWNVGVNAEETTLIFEASQRTTNLSSYGDLYVSRRDSVNHQWSKGVPLSKVNTAGSNLMPRFTPDETHLFYGNTDTLESRDANIKYINADTVLGHTKPAEYIAVANRSEHVISLINLETYEVASKVNSGKGPHEVVSVAGGWVTASYGVYNDISDVTKTPRQLKFKSDPSDGLVYYDLDTKTRTVFSLENCARPHGVTSSPDGSLIWATCEEEQAITEIDMLSGKELARWNTQANGSHIVIYDEHRNRLYVGNVGSGSVSIIDRETGATKIIETDDGAEGLAITPDGARLWVTNTQANSLSVIDLINDELVTTFRSHGRFPVKVGITPDGKETWVTQNNSRELTIFDTNAMNIVKTIPLASVPLGILIAPSGNKVFVSLPRLDRIDVFDTRTKERITSFSPGIEPDGMAWIVAD